MHEAYLSLLRTLSAYDLKNEEVARLLAATNNITARSRRPWRNRPCLRADCQKKMLQHFDDVSRTMPAGARKRYLAWVRNRPSRR